MHIAANGKPIYHQYARPPDLSMEASLESAADRANQHMVNRLIARGALRTPALIAAFRETPRHRFVDRVYQFRRKSGDWREIITRDPGPDEIQLVYSDRALVTAVSGPRNGEPGTPISSSSQPSIMAQMLEDLNLCRGLRVLEIGAWTGWFDSKKRRGDWTNFVHGLAFFALMRGLRVEHRTLESGESTFGLCELGGAAWLGFRVWRVSGEKVYRLACETVEAFLDKGAPRPTEYNLEATPHVLGLPRDDSGGWVRGPFCWQRWTTARRNRGEDLKRQPQKGYNA
jgi:hypothetical protein